MIDAPANQATTSWLSAVIMFADENRWKGGQNVHLSIRIAQYEVQRVHRPNPRVHRFPACRELRVVRLVGEDDAQARRRRRADREGKARGLRFQIGAVQRKSIRSNWCLRLTPKLSSRSILRLKLTVSPTTLGVSASSGQRPLKVRSNTLASHTSRSLSQTTFQPNQCAAETACEPW